MESHRFDALSRTFAKTQSRRALFSLLLVGGATVRSKFPDAFAAPKRKRNNSAIVRAVVKVHGRKRNVRKGDVVAKGRHIVTKGRSGNLDDAGDTVTCQIPEIEYGLIGTGVESAAIMLKIEDDCEVVVASIEIGVDPPEEFDERLDLDRSEPSSRSGNGRVVAQAAEVRRQTGGWHEHKDVAGIVLTEAYAHIKYRDDGRRVSDGTGQLSYCRNVLDGWFGTGSLGDWSETTRTIWIWKRCNFSFINGSFKHRLDVDVYNWPDNDWAVYCTKGGNFAPRAKFYCGKAHRQI